MAVRSLVTRKFFVTRRAFISAKRASALGLASLALAIAIPPAFAQAQDRPVRHHQRAARTRIEINPRPLLYRRCEDWYVLQHRPSGTVLFPQYHCWWVRG